MAIYGVGAYYDGDKDVSGDFVQNELVGVGWPTSDAPELQEYFKSLKWGISFTSRQPLAVAI